MRRLVMSGAAVLVTVLGIAVPASAGPAAHNGSSAVPNYGVKQKA